ncbi:hypothetical protein DENIS_3392 [Desulfonema ishimotonii]|uniref:Uncharacterized protein n=1 Tax=Desulfonema ishimotonii TaxID=45657 RepID=A0A401FZN5_9BACT|nr:hypothetical protein [Desulfonema ishimotonii]GBC62420.1 hypothetical protein DENIS_3392 [Desulfonema ishimotonii]
MRRFIQLHTIIFIIIYLSSNSYGYTDVTKLNCDGFRLGLSFEEAINIFKNSGYVENNDVKKLAEGEYGYKSDNKNDLPCVILFARGKNSLKYSILFANGELIEFNKHIDHEEKTDRRVLQKKYCSLFGVPESSWRANQKSYLIWGGVVKEFPFDPRFTSIKVELSDTIEYVRILSFHKTLYAQFAESLERYVKANKLYETQLQKNLKLAHEHIPKITSLIKGDLRYRQIQIHPFEGNGGEIQISGFVREGDLKNLKEIVNSTSPPVKIDWVADEFPADIFDDITKE